MIVYIVSSGEYSDYSIDGVFENQEKALDYISKRNWKPYDTKIEIWEDVKQTKQFSFDLDCKLKIDWVE